MSGGLGGGGDPAPPAVGVVVAGATKMVALTDLVGSATLVAEIVTGVSTLTAGGAEYNPPEIVPGPCVIDQSACWSALPVTDAMNCWVCPAFRKTKAGDTEMLTGTEGGLMGPVETGSGFSCTVAW